MGQFTTIARLVIFSSFIFAIILTKIPFPSDLEYMRPEWCMLVLIFWVLTLPNRVGVISGWFFGILLDLSQGLLLGQYGLAMALVAFLTNSLRSRMRLFLFWQQALVVFVLVGFGKLILFWVQWLIGNQPYTLLYWYSCVASVFVWPIVSFLLKYLQRSFKFS